MAADGSEGRIKLDSGDWTWRVTELGAGTAPYKVGNRPAGERDPDPRPESPPVLVLEDPNDPDHWMTRELDRALRDEDIAEDDVGALGRDPDQRQVVDPEGKTWKVERIRSPRATRKGADFEEAPEKIKVTSEGGPERTIIMPEGRYLGQLTRKELIQLVGSGPGES